MKFSIIMPTFNRQAHITKAIHAILNQDYEDWELIIQNGGEEIVVPDDPRIRLFTEKDRGITDAMNRGMKKATGDVLNWSNDDDEMAPGTLRFMAENLKPDDAWSYGYITMTNGVNSFPWGRHGTLSELVQGNFVPQPSVFWRKETYEAVGEMDESEDLTSDYEYWLRMWSYKEPRYFDRSMALYHIHPESITVTRTAEQLAQARRTAEKYIKKAQ